MRARHGKVLVCGLPRLARPRPRKNADGLTAFSLIDPAGNWTRVFRRASDVDATPAGPASALRKALLNAVVVADSEDDDAQGAKVLRGGSREPTRWMRRVEKRRNS